MIGFWQIVIILVVAFLFFGPSRIEKLGPALGKAIRGFKKGLSGDAANEDSDEDPSKATASKKDDDSNSAPKA